MIRNVQLIDEPHRFLIIYEHISRVRQLEAFVGADIGLRLNHSHIFGRNARVVLINGY